MVDRLFKDGWYLIKPDKKQKMHLNNGFWGRIFPDPIKDNELSKRFKISDVFKSRKMEKKNYLKYLMDQVDLVGEVENFDKVMKKICNWCGEDDIICVPDTFIHFEYVLTGTLLKGERTGYINHYLWLNRIKWNTLMSKWRLWKISHFPGQRDREIEKKKREREEALSKLVTFARGIGARESTAREVVNNLENNNRQNPQN